VTALAVQAAAKRYLAQQALRVVFVGRPEFVGTASSLGLAPIARTDFAGRVVDGKGESLVSGAAQRASEGGIPGQGGRR
jgi:hypothetical protein